MFGWSQKVQFSTYAVGATKPTRGNLTMGAGWGNDKVRGKNEKDEIRRKIRLESSTLSSMDTD